MSFEDYLPEWEDLWAVSDMDPEKFFTLAVQAGRLDITQYEYELEAIGIEPNSAQFLVGREYTIPTIEEEIERLGIVTPLGIPAPESVESKLTEYFKVAFHETLVSLWQWTLEKLKALVDAIVGAVKPVAERAWELANGKLQEFGLAAYNQFLKLFEGFTPIKPEDAGPLAAKLYIAAMTAGMGAHGVSIVTELLHPLKSMGLHQTAAMIGDFGQFGRIGGAIMSPVVNGVLGKVMQYSFNAAHRPQIPRENLLIELRSKREITKPQFDQAMAYQGFSDPWINSIERWQWKDPRMFEILRIADVGMEQGPAPAEEADWFRTYGVTGDRLKDWWLWRKFMRAGYEDVDIPVMVRLVHRREVAFALTYVRTAIRRNYRWGYLTDDELGKWMDRLSLPEQAREWIFWAGELDRDYFYKQDLVSYYKLAYRNDVLDEDELTVSLVAMGMPARDVTLTVRTEKVRKKPKPSAPRPPAEARPTAKIQTAYIQLYREQYRKGLISSGRFLESLLAIDLDPELAELTVDLEVTKKAPEPA